ncbi:hypothetical protein IMZ48_41290 [Candidatus Bathyarchaeota archaeon]|nr:hypothetical protein [Candidatus Bathyarchaeota archaeon]
MPLSCFENQDDREAYQAGTTLLYDESNDAPGELWNRTGVIAKACKETMEGGELVGTAFVARDLMQVVDALDEDGLLRYWGEFSLLQCTPGLNGLEC